MNAVSPPASRRHDSAQARWERLPVIRTGEDYIASLKGRGTRLFLFGELIDEPADHPMIRPSINALRATYDLAIEDPGLATAHSPLIDAPVNRFLHMPTGPHDLVMKNRMQRRLGQITGTGYHRRYLEFLKEAQRRNVLIAAGMTDPKGDRSKRPAEQADPDMFLHITDRNEDGVFVRGVKAHMTGGWNQHWICVMPTMNLGEADHDYAVVGMIPGDAEGITYIYGRQASDTRSMEGGDIDQGNAQYGGQEVWVYFDDVFIPTSICSWTASTNSPRRWWPASPPTTAPATSAKPGSATSWSAPPPPSPTTTASPRSATSRTSWWKWSTSTKPSSPPVSPAPTKRNRWTAAST